MSAVHDGFSVAIRRKDGSEFLCASAEGILPPVFVERKWAVKLKRRLISEGGFRARVVPVTFYAVDCLELKEARPKRQRTKGKTS